MTPAQLFALVVERNRMHGGGKQVQRGTASDLIAMKPPVKVAG